MHTSTEAFLRHILPTEGYYCCATFKGGHCEQYFTPSIDALVERILVEDANGNTVYHACATYLSPGRRTQDNARCARGLWLDIDAGDGKPYADVDQAAHAVSAFARIANLNDPTCVESGSGLHCYWTVDANIPAKEWRDLADAFRELCDRHDLQADHSRTCDIASILRPVGTTNRKLPGNPRRVTCR
jgi:hypothetical protein